MNAFQIMLVPTRTIPGWPSVPEPTLLETLGLLVGAPALVIAIVYAVAKIGTVAQAGRATASPVIDPVWVGGREREDGRMEGEEIDEDLSGADSPQPGGGARARW